MAPPVKTSWLLASFNNRPAYSTTWFSGRNHWPDTCSDRLMSRPFMSSGPMPVKWVFSRWLMSGRPPSATGNCRGSSWLFTWLSDSITTAMKLLWSTGISSKRRTVAAVLWSATV